MKRISSILCLAAALGCLAPAAMQAQEGKDVKVEFLGTNNTLVRIAGEGKYLLLPIQDNGAEATVNVIVDGKQATSFVARLATNKVDYTVPFDLTPYRGKKVVLNIVSHQSRSTVREAKEDACWRSLTLSDTFDTANREKYRPAYHHTPLYGWMNDPNGMFYRDGVWHLYYQYNPYCSLWQNMSWGHSTSTDLIHWEHQPMALQPDVIGTIFSGSSVIDHEGTAGFGKGAVVAMYTSAELMGQCQALAYSTDNGQTFTKYEGNPIITEAIPDFRDPNFFWNEETKEWNLVLACGQEMRFYASDDLKQWRYLSAFGSNYGCHAGVWECPDLFPLKDEQGNTHWVLICNINPGGPSGGSATQYFIGDFDGSKFTLDNPEMYLDGKALWQDYGKDHYAAVSFSNAPDGRHTMIAWMSNWEYANNVPTMQFRSANTIAREPFLYNVDGKVYLGSRPSPEYVGAGLDKTVKVNGSCTVTLSNENGEEFVITYDQKAMTLSCDRSRSGMVDFSQHFNTVATAPVCRRITSFRIFVDNCSVEVFANDGEVCMTSLVFPSQPLNTVTVNKIK